jgi:hypothetical protein
MNSSLNPAIRAAHPEARPEPKPRRTVRQILLSYFYWTYSRGSFHYDVMVTLILLFIFLTPHIPGWSYGDAPSSTAGLAHPMQVVSNGGRGLIVTVDAADVTIPAGASEKAVRQALRKAIEPVTGDAVVVERWETVRDAGGNLEWKVWAHR